jgi:hypothetical protein
MADLRERVARAIAYTHSGPRVGPVTPSFYKMADAVLAELAPELQPQAEPVGEWAMVPREPTDRMLGAGINAAVCRAGKASWCPEVWAAMLAAAPQPQPRPQASAEDITRIQSILYRAFVYRQDEEAWQRIRASLGVGK